jgi:hypothetical protein
MHYSHHQSLQLPHFHRISNTEVADLPNHGQECSGYFCIACRQDLFYAPIQVAPFLSRPLEAILMAIGWAEDPQGVWLCSYLDQFRLFAQKRLMPRGGVQEDKPKQALLVVLPLQ